ncbi:MAG: DNA methyltransferase [Gammaproteobacteria bacterium]|nr:DNA methyltransferase [Gammaproteobacteria bacterium]
MDQITDDFPKLMEAIESARYAHSDGMGAFMCFMAVRLLAMHRVLKPTGSIYLHCDPTASHYLKAVMDAVFGWKNFRNEIAWCYRGGGVPRDGFGKKHDLIFRYSKGKAATFNVDAVRIPYSEDSAQRLKYKAKAFTSSGTYDNYEQNPKGKHPEDWWIMQPIMPSAKERLGYPTQKPLSLYERIVKASSNEGDVVLDPFCGCATTLVAAERLKRRWVGVDIWEKAHETVIRRLQREGLEGPRGSVGEALPFYGKIHYAKEPPERTDDGETAAPFLRVKERVKEPEGPKWSRQDMYDHLLNQNGMKCQGCDRDFDDPRYLELDHNTPRADGGINHISNRILLCSPCNRAKSNVFTLSGLRRHNKKMGWMAK